MKLVTTMAAFVLLTVFGTFVAFADEAGRFQDPRAVEVLDKLTAYTSSLDQFVITGEVSADARLDAGLIVSNPVEIVIKIDRPGSLHLSSFDGVETQHIYLNSGRLTVYGTETNYFAHASVPKNIEEGMLAALEEFDVDAPLGELFFGEAGKEMLLAGAEVFYLTDKSRIGGVDCHHIVVRGPESDVQIWIEEGSKPILKKMMTTMKWESGSPRFFAELDWKQVNEFDADTFDFKAPEGALEIKFMGSE